MIRKLVLGSSFVSLMSPVLSLDCHTGENFKMYCGSRDQDIIYSDRCHMVPFPETDSDYSKFLPLHKCEISSEEKDTDFECFIELEYPELSDDFVKTVYDFEINSKKVDLESRYEHGVLVKGVKAGCRKKVVHLVDFKKNNGMPDDMCFPVESGLLDDAKKKQNYTCGCYANTDEEPCADCAPKTSCNAVFYPPRSTVHEIYTKRDEIVRERRRAEEL